VRADIYSMGVLLFELIAGRPPFWGPHAAVREMHISNRPPRLSTADRAIPAALEQAVMRCLQKDRDKRFESARDLRIALESTRAEELDAQPVPSSRAVASQAPLSSRLTVGLVFFESAAALPVVETRIRALGGQLAYAAGGRHVAV